MDSRLARSELRSQYDKHTFNLSRPFLFWLYASSGISASFIVGNLLVTLELSKYTYKKYISDVLGCNYGSINLFSISLLVNLVWTNLMLCSITPYTAYPFSRMLTENFNLHRLEKSLRLLEIRTGIRKEGVWGWIGGESVESFKAFIWREAINV